MVKKASGLSFRFLFLLFIAVVSTVSLFCSGVIESQDGWLYLSVAKNIYYEHKIEAAPDEYPIQNVHINSSKDEKGRWHTTGALGYSLAMVPAVALSDIVHQILHTPPSNHFPLEHDWTLHFFASFTNAWFAGLLVIMMALYLFDLTGKRDLSVIVALLTLFATNMLPLSKFGFPHMLFTLLVVCSFFLVRRFALTQKLKYLLLFFITYVGVCISYNVSYYIPVIPLILYYFLLLPKERRVKQAIILLVLGLVSLIVFPILLSIIRSYSHIYPKVVFEGVWGFLFSPGKSMFIYSPILVIPIMFWGKIHKKYVPEMLSFVLLSLLFLYLLGTSWMVHANGVLSPMWHGGMSWGPRYISTLIPFWMIGVGLIVMKLSQRVLLFIVLPILIGSFWVQLVGVSLAYQLQYAGTPPYSLYVGDQELSVYDYGSFVPRFSPVYVLSREFLVKLKKFKSTVDHGQYNVRFYDGFEVPLFTGLGPYRGFRSEGHVFFTQSANDPIKKIFLRFYNAADFPTSSSSAVLHFSVNSKLMDTLNVPNDGNAEKELNIDSSLLHAGRNRFDLVADYPATTSAQQVVYISQMVINDKNVNLESLDYPEVSTGGNDISPIAYQYFGNRMNDNWKLWYLRARISERTFDFWWIKNLYYWDRPQTALWILFGANVFVVVTSWTYLYLQLKKAKGKP